MPTEAEHVLELESLRARLAASEAVCANAQAARCEAEQRIRALVDHAPEAIVVLDVESARFIDVNPQAERLFGLSRDKLLEVGPFDLSPPLQPGGACRILDVRRSRQRLAGASPCLSGGT